jgi:hypothetical protein
MATSDTEIANLALGHLGQGNEILNLQTTKSPEAYVFRRLYDTVRRSTLRDFSWGFAHKVAPLGLVTQYGDALHPTSEWGYAYRRPSDCLLDRKIQSGIRNDNRQSRVTYKSSRDSSGPIILTDKSDAVLEYTVDIVEVELYPDDFVLAFSLRLAMYGAPRICGEDPNRMGRRAADLYSFEISRAQNNNRNEEQDEEDPSSELERSRI